MSFQTDRLSKLIDFLIHTLKKKLAWCIYYSHQQEHYIHWYKMFARHTIGMSSRHRNQPNQKEKHPHIQDTPKTTFCTSNHLQQSIPQESNVENYIQYSFSYL